MSRPLTTWLAAIAIALVLASAHMLDGPSDIEAAADVAADVQDAQAQAAQAATTGRVTSSLNHPEHQP